MSQAQVRDPFGAPAHASPSSFWQRVIGAARLEPGAWQEILDDASSTAQAGVVVASVALVGASTVFFAVEGTLSIAIQSALWTLSSWAILALLLWGLAHWFRHSMRAIDAFRIVGFSMAPLALLALAAIPVAAVQMVVRLLAFSLFFAALVGGTRQALRVETMRAAFVCVMTGLVTIFLLMLLLLLAAGV